MFCKSTCSVLVTAENFKKGIVLADPISMVNGMEDYKMDEMKNCCKLCSPCDHFALASATSVSPNAPRRYLSLGLS